MGRVFRRRRDGTLEVRLSADERELLRIVARDIARVVAEPPSGAIADRLFPRAYLDPTEEDAEAEFEAIVQGDLQLARVAALKAMTEQLDAAEPDGGERVELVLGPGADEQWLTALNDARLVIGTSLGITDDDHEFDPDDPRAELIFVYGWLIDLQSDLVDLLSDEIGEAGADD